MIDPISMAARSIANNPANRETNQKPAGEMFSNFQQMFDEVNRNQLEAENNIVEMVAGRNKDIAGTMVSMEKADTSVRMLMSVRNKIVSAYEEIMRMQV